MTGTQISAMTPEPTLPDGGVVPFVVPPGTVGFDPQKNYIYDLGKDLLTRVSYTALALPAAAASVGSTDGNVQADIDARPTTAALAAPTGGAMVGVIDDGAGGISRTLDAKAHENRTAGDKGADPTGVADSTTALQNLFADMATTGRVNLLSGTYKVTQPLVIPPGVIEGGDVVLDFSTADPGDFPDEICVLAEGGARTQLPNLSADLAISARQMAFSSPHGLAVGDSFNISGTVDYAGNGWRSYYTKGEMFRVAIVVDSTTIITENACRDTYAAADVEVWKRSGDMFTQGCAKLTVIAPDTIRYPVYFSRLDRLTLNNLRVTGGSNTGIVLEDCYGASGVGVYAQQTIDTFEGYGIGVFNCQDVTIRGTVYGRFNGFTVGGGTTSGGGVGMNRDIHFEGIGGSHPTTGLAGANLHGNAEYCSFRGFFSNGVVLGGDKNEAHGEFVKSSGFSPLQWAEMHGHTFKVTGRVTITAGPDVSTSIGAINQSGYGQNVNGSTTARYGGVTELDIVLRAPKATRLLIWRPTDLARTDVVLKLGLDIMEAHPSTRIVATGRNGTGNEWPVIEFTRLNIVDNAVAINWSIGSGTKLRGLRRTLSASVSGTAVTSASAAATLNPNFPRTPTFTVSSPVPAFASTTRLVSSYASPSTTGCTVTVATADNSSANISSTVAVVASLDDQ